MSETSTRIREYVNDLSVADYFGAWGALRPDQRRQIRELCDLCDMFEQTADKLNEDIERLQKAISEYEETSGLKQAKQDVAKRLLGEIETNIKHLRKYQYCNAPLAYVFHILDEQKKKYTEGET